MKDEGKFVLGWLMVALVLLHLGTVLVAEENWGVRPYKEEKLIYDALVLELKKKQRELDSDITAVAKKLEMFWAEWPPNVREESLRWFRSSKHYNPEAARRRDWSRMERNEAERRYENYAGSTMDISEETIVARSQREAQWSAYVEYLHQDIKYKEAKLRYNGIEMQGIKPYEGIYWTGFINDCLGDMRYIAESCVRRLPDKLYDCFLNISNSYLKSSMLGRDLPTLAGANGRIMGPTGEIYKCAKAISLKTIVDALEDAFKKQFVDNMKDKGIERAVAEYWWSDIVMPSAVKKSRFDQAWKQFTTKKFYLSQIKEEGELWLHKNLANDIKPQIRKRLKTLSNVDRYGENAKKLVNRVAMKRTAKHISLQFLEAASFSFDYGERALLVFYNQAEFEAIAPNLLFRYKFIKKCLEKKERSADAPAIIKVFKCNPKEQRDFIRDCKNGKTEPEIDALLKQAKNNISACRLQEAEQALEEAKSKSDSLSLSKGGTYRQVRSRITIYQEIAKLTNELKNARATYCRTASRPSSLDGTWKWFNGDKVRITRGGAHSLTRSWVRASVIPDPKKPNCFIFTWYEHNKKTWVDNLRLSDDKNRLGGANTMGGDVSATRMGTHPSNQSNQRRKETKTQQRSPKRSCEECVRQYCPQCGELLFCTSNDPSCANCITKNKAAIDACQK
ncbi:hypothetical protein ACLHDG_05090 [Sulfurovum sp. CS9]|uniref:hypothetical protein n=1 Tax=Sulfurovum sp. CS9 TaxID=3391146 RepID=UPI0039EA7810